MGPLINGVGEGLDRACKLLGSSGLARGRFLFGAAALLPYLFDDFSADETVESGPWFHESCIDIFKDQIGFLTFP